MTTTKSSEERWREAEEKAVALSAEYEEKRLKLREQYRDRINNAAREAADLQKEFLNDQVVQSLLDRPDGQALAGSLNINLPEAN